ncbi:MAG: glycosyltransferase family 39 protein, partial [bacterium]
LGTARAVIILFGALLCAIVWRASRKRYGKIGGIMSLAACALSPAVIAHSRLITTDVPAALFAFLFMLAVLDYWRKPSFVSMALVAAALGAGALTKFTGLFWAPFAFAAPLLAAALARRNKIEKPKLRVFAGHLVLAVALIWLLLVAGYGAGKVKVHNRDPKPASSSLRSVWPVMKMVPLPSDYVRGLDRQLYDAEKGEFRKDNYLLGQSYSGGKWYYFPVAVAVKEPVIYLALFAGTLALLAAGRQRRQEELVLLFLVAVFFVAACSFGSLQIGVRYLLPVYPACFLLLGKLGSFAFAADVKDVTGKASKAEDRLSAKRGGRRFLRAALVFALALLLVEHIMIWPHYLAYFNALAGGPSNGYRVLRDSNLDWGQDLPELKRWMKRQGVDTLDLAYYGHDDPRRFDINYSLPARNSKNSFIAISANFITGKKYPLLYAPEDVGKTDPMWEEIKRYRKLKPVAMPGYSMFVYNKVRKSHGNSSP